MQRFYFDHNATTPVSPEVLQAMTPMLAEVYGNASSLHHYGQAARKHLDEARRHTASLLGAAPEEIVFTSGGTEADNLALLGFGAAQANHDVHVITTTVEHPAVLAAAAQLASATYVSVDSRGLVDPDDIRRALRPGTGHHTKIISVIHANNELGTIQPIAEIARIAREAGVAFHSDGVQAAGKIEVDVNQLGVTLYSIAGHKLYAPKGVGALFVRKGTRLAPMLHGGNHERNRRAGTENVAGAVALGRAAQWMIEHGPEESRRLETLRDGLEQSVLDRIPGVRINGAGAPRVSNTSNLRFEGIDTEPLLIALDLRGFAVSSGSACSSGASEPSHVLTAIGLTREQARSSLRISLGRSNDAGHIDALVDALVECVAHLRRLAPSHGPPLMLKQTIAVAMSGGVDSSVVAGMLHARGETVVGLTMQLWNQRRLPQLSGDRAPGDRPTGRCCSIEDVYDARHVAQSLGIPYYVVNFEQRFEDQVVKPFIGEYLAGRTPIPCTLCNNFIKFDQFLEMAEGVGASRIATGHYARIALNPASGRWELRRGVDHTKDQTYFLFGLTQDQLARALFPLGGMQKPEVRALARELQIPTADKPDSQEICFVPNGDYAAFIDAYFDEQGASRQDLAGELVTSDGQVVGEHSGVHHFTVGQRRGLRIAASEPLYVISTEPATRRVIIGRNDDLLRSKMHVNQVNWISIAPPSEALPSEPVRAEVKIRNKHAAAAAILTPPGPGRVEISFDDPQRAVTPGQGAVFYSGDLVLGGGWIE